jgi:hypothetical protein
MGIGGPFLGVKHGWVVTLSTHPHLVPRSTMSKSYSFSPPWRMRGGSVIALLFYFTFYILKAKFNDKLPAKKQTNYLSLGIVILRRTISCPLLFLYYIIFLRFYLDTLSRLYCNWGIRASLGLILGCLYLASL